MPVSLELIEIFRAVAEHEGFTQAGVRLGLSQQVVSKKIRALEATMGVMLFRRSTRAVSLTEAGRVLYAESQAGYEALRNAIARAQESNALAMGMVRITAPHVVNARVLVASAARFRAAHPAIQLSLSSSDRLVDLARERVDFAVTLGRMRDGDYVARRLLGVELGIYASPAFLTRHGTPAAASDLGDLPGVHYRAPDATSPWEWRLFKGRRSIVVAPAMAMLADDPEVEFQAACAGVGIALLPNFMTRDALRAGQLKRLLPDWASQGYDLFARYPSRRHLSAASRLFLAHLIADLQPDR